MLRDGTLVSGGGKDRKLISWNGNYQKLHKTEVRQRAGPLPFILDLTDGFPCGREGFSTVLKTV